MCILAAQSQLCFRCQQSQGSESTSPRPGETCDQILDLLHVIRKVIDYLDATDLLLIHFMGALAGAFPHTAPRPWAAVEDRCNVGMATTPREGVNEHSRCLYLCCPTLLAEATTAIDKQHNVESPVACQGETASINFASLHVALLILQS